MDFGQFPEQMVFFVLGNGVLFLTVLIGFALRGPVRWVRIATLALLVNFVVGLSVHAGWESALRLVAITAVTTFGLVGLAFHTWRHPVQKCFEAAEPEACPAHARRSLERWTGELEALGFAIHAEHKTYWKLQSQPRLTFVRFFIHHSEPFWVELHALENPKLAARMVVSDKGDGRAVLSCDKQADQELFRDSFTRVQRLPSASSCGEMIEQHRKLAMTSEGSLRRVDDPVEGHVNLYGGWVQRLLASGQVRTIEPGWVALVPASIPGMILRTYAAWFH